MALDNAALLEVLEAIQAAGVEDRVRTAAQTIYQALIDAELTAVIGAGPWERSDQRTTQRNGSRPRTLTTTAGDLELRIPKLSSVLKPWVARRPLVVPDRVRIAWQTSTSRFSEGRPCAAPPRTAPFVCR